MRMTMIVLMVLISNRARQARQRRQSALAPLGRQKKRRPKGRLMKGRSSLVAASLLSHVAAIGMLSSCHELLRRSSICIRLSLKVGARETLIPPLTFKSRHLIQFSLGKVRQAFSFLSFRMLFQATTLNVLLLLPVSVEHWDLSPKGKIRNRYSRPSR